MENNPYLSKKYLVNQITKAERLALKESLLGKTIMIIVNKNYGLFTEHGFPVAVAYCPNQDTSTFPSYFLAKVVEIHPMITIEKILL